MESKNFLVCSTQGGDWICECDTFEQGEEIIRQFEEEDRKNDVFEPYSYEVIEKADADAYYPLPYEMKTLNDVERFAKHLKKKLKIAVHPDDDFSSLVGSHGITTEIADRYNEYMDKAFEVCEANNKDIYDLVLNVYGLD